MELQRKGIQGKACYIPRRPGKACKPRTVGSESMRHASTWGKTFSSREGSKYKQHCQKYPNTNFLGTEAC